MSEEENVLNGAFMDSLRRNNKQIRDDRALAITEDAELLYKREIEDIQTELKRVLRDREAMLDMGGTSTMQIISVSDFNAKAFVKKDIELGLKARELEITLEVAQKRYNKLFTKPAE